MLRFTEITRKDLEVMRDWKKNRIRRNEDKKYRSNIMSTVRFFMPPVSVMGPGSLKDATKDIATMGFKKALIINYQFYSPWEHL